MLERASGSGCWRKEVEDEEASIEKACVESLKPGVNSGGRRGTGLYVEKEKETG